MLDLRIEIIQSLGTDGLNAVDRFGPNWARGNVGKGGHEEKKHAEARAAARADSVRTLQGDLVTDPAGQLVIEQARLTATIAEVAGAFNAQVQNVRRSSALSGASTYLTTAEAPAFGGGFALALQAESAVLLSHSFGKGRGSHLAPFPFLGKQRSSKG
ncbi:MULTISPECIES: hypothetical protein [unclassified Leucobacter]|uniref:hypothetical protein n=1 Tax=unclassified Leucobacter TaxID=2621730 RepID=UPI00165D4417|nr:MULTISPECIES: hypothetical protein [unclassified Leucobacter]MBC9937419.1 hypothetical protein [Leucobacter sp. cx-87]